METDAKESESACDIESELDGNKKADAMKKALLYMLQKRFVDYYATIHGYNCVNRYVIRDAIEAVREKNVCKFEAMCEYAGFVLNAFCNELEQINHEAA